ncbi:hypothetical protein ASPFODRAFT_41849 [Aspergillus luchuensis CBS 106.47]|uniref:Uncharacterized protein n=1 Tax=Aspergillus luchuensis (strain CBS 106.47) TaxID=1137211 RepID=A0A1M3TX57_ASPLC|nr:hypothetical protein ASPFODRAFT_41849 [Aspergillus luchuensis CBS 106.47]
MTRWMIEMLHWFHVRSYPFEPGGRSTCCDGCMPRRTEDSVPSHRDHPIDLPINTVASATLGDSLTNSKSSKV